MNDIELTGVMQILRGLFNEKKMVTREEVENLTRLSPTSIPKTYFMETGECIVKVNPSRNPSICSGGFKHTHYIRVKDMNSKGLIELDDYLSDWEDGSRNFSSELKEQINKRMKELLSNR